MSNGQWHAKMSLMTQTVVATRIYSGESKIFGVYTKNPEHIYFFSLLLSFFFWGGGDFFSSDLLV